MILQTDARFPPYFRRFGCFYMSIVYLFRKDGEYQTANEIIKLYETLVRTGDIRHEGTPPTEPWYRCWIQNPANIAESISNEKWKYKRITPKKEVPKGARFLCECKTQFNSIHFSVPSQNGTIYYNPDPTLVIKTVLSKRVFTRPA